MNDVTHERFLELIKAHCPMIEETLENATKRKALMPWFDKMSFDMGFETALGWLEIELWPDTGLIQEAIRE